MTQRARDEILAAAAIHNWVGNWEGHFRVLLTKGDRRLWLKFSVNTGRIVFADLISKAEVLTSNKRARVLEELSR
jgi:hypothetical protein